MRGFKTLQEDRCMEAIFPKSTSMCMHYDLSGLIVYWSNSKCCFAKKYVSISLDAKVSAPKVNQRQVMT